MRYGEGTSSKLKTQIVRLSVILSTNFSNPGIYRQHRFKFDTIMYSKRPFSIEPEIHRDVGRDFNVMNEEGDFSENHERGVMVEIAGKGYCVPSR